MILITPEILRSKSFPSFRLPGKNGTRMVRRPAGRDGTDVIDLFFMVKSCDHFYLEKNTDDTDDTDLHG